MRARMMIAPFLAAALALFAFIATFALAETQAGPAQPAAHHAQDLRTQDLHTQDLRAQDLRAQDLHAQAQQSPAAQSAAQAPSPKGAHAACFSNGEAREAVGAKKVIAPDLALRAARQQGVEALRARLCTLNAKPAYFVTSLAKDGKVTWIVVDATTGAVVEKR